MRRAVLLMATVVLAPWLLLAQSAAGAVDLSELLVRLGASIERYYSRAESIVCTETVSVWSLAGDLMPDRTPLRRLTFDLRVAWERSVDGAAPEATIQRELLKVNNRTPRPNDKPACTDPSDVSPDALDLFLPSKQGDFTFAVAGRTRFRGRAAILIDYRPKKSGPLSIRPRDGVEDCWHVDMPGSTRGRAWIDEETTDVLRLDERLATQIDVQLPRNPKRYDSGQAVTFERLDSSTTYRAVSFTDPIETIMLPASVDSISIIRNSGAPRMRMTTTLSNYRRFTTGARIVQ